MNRYRLLCAATAALTAALAVVVPAAPASAHTQLKSTVPAAMSTASQPVTEVTLTFTDLVRQSGTAVVVTGQDRASHSAGDATVLDRTITQKVDALPLGLIRVAWKTFASDGHELVGTFMFTNRAAPPSPTAEPSLSLSPVPSTAAPLTSGAQVPSPVGQASDGSSSSGAMWAVLVAAILALAALAALLWRRGRRSGS